MLLKYRDILASRLVEERQQWVLWLPVALASGIASYFALMVEPPFYLGLAGLLISAGLMWLGRSARSALWMLAIALFAFSLGFAAAQGRTERVAAPVIDKKLRAIHVEGRITNIESRIKGLRVTLDSLRISTLGPRRTPGKIRVTLAGIQPRLAIGDWVKGRFGLSPPPPPAAPGAYDFQRRAYFMGIGGVGFSYGAVTVTETAGSGGGPGIMSAIGNLRRLMARRVTDYFADRDQVKTGAVINALMTGDRGRIPAATMDTFRQSGLAHLLAISGLHIGLIAGIVFFGVRAMLALAGTTALKYPIKKWAAVAAMAAALGYTLIAGATVPTIRAFLMIGLVLSAILFDRRGLSMRLVGFAAAAILLVQPEALLGVSFQLSFAAVIALIAAYEALSAWRLRRKKFGSYSRSVWRKPLLYLAGVALTTLIAGSATAPFASFHFGRFPHYGMIANVLAVPVTALWVMPWMIIAIALMPLGLESLALTPMGWGVDLVLSIADRVAHLPGAVSLLPAMPGWTLGVMAFGGLWLCLWRRRWRFFGVAAMAMALASLNFSQSPDVLIDHQGRLMAVKDNAGGLAVSTRRAGRFTSDTWLRRAALKKPSSWPTGNSGTGGKSETADLTCDSLGCLYGSGGMTVALVTHVAALAEDCAVASVVISTVPTRGRCRGPRVVIDRFDLWRNGAYALWLNNGDIRIESVNGQRGERPWVPKRSQKPGINDGP